MTPVQKFETRVNKINSLVCVGLDADIDKLPARFKTADNPQFEFNKYIIDQTAEFAAAFKPNTAFYEARGDQGLRELKMTIDYLRKKYPDVFTILDAKRADIGNTNNGYVAAIFDWLGFDAVTLNAYGGREAMKPFLDRADKACIIWCRSSNPGAGEFQNLLISPSPNPSHQGRGMGSGFPPLNGEGKGGAGHPRKSADFLGNPVKPLWQVMAEHVRDEWNYNNNCMLVAGATYPEELKEIREIVEDMTLLIPGIGAQGGDVVATVKAGVNSEGRGMVISSSRGIIFADDPAAEAKKLRDEINIYR